MKDDAAVMRHFDTLWRYLMAGIKARCKIEQRGDGSPNSFSEKSISNDACGGPLSLIGHGDHKFLYFGTR